MKIAIQGHLTKGEEVIRILESLGGKNTSTVLGFNALYYYYINSNNMIVNSLITIKTKDEFKLYTLEDFEKEFPFKIGDKVTDHEGDVAIITGFAYIEEKLGYSLQYENGRGTATPRILKPYKEMKEERNITLTLDKAKEWYNKGGELKEIALQAFTENELNPLPRSWEEFCKKCPVKKGECFLESDDGISVVSHDFVGKRVYKNWIPSKKSAESHLAMIQLEQLRNCWRQGWEPKPHESVYAIKFSNGGLRVYYFSSREFLSFPTKEMAEEFFECFRDLIEKAGDLI